LTRQDFCNYSVAMDAALTMLEEKIREAVQLCERLRSENHDLRQQLLALQNDRTQLGEKMDHARTRLEGLLKQLPG
jgi:cell division protein ZapB